ncbi:MAG: diaminopimelate decarboxylase [Alphaproteobacteria bacterium]
MSESPFTYREGALHAERVPLARIAAAVGTPAYVYCGDAIAGRYRRLARAFGTTPVAIYYALKANSNQAVIATLAAEGAGADVVSAGEIARAVAAGVAPEKIVFAGVGKTADEIAYGLAAGIRQFNVESLPELALLNRVALERGAVAEAALRINPNVDARTHAKITTGKAENKFGVDLGHVGDAFAAARAMPGVRLTGLSTHIGSQLTSLEPYEQAFGRLAALTGELRGAGFAVDHLDLGGGLGVDYHGARSPAVEDYAALILRSVGGLDCSLAIEPGRWLVAPAGVLLARVVQVKEGATRRFLIIDAAMNDLIRPTLYDAHHEILPVRQPAANAPTARADVVGPICESGDTFARDRDLPALAVDDLMVFRDAGAYGAVMASTYNSRPLVPEVLVKGDDFAVVRPRQTIEALIGLDRLPPWLGRESPAVAAQIRSGAAE